MNCRNEELLKNLANTKNPCRDEGFEYAIGKAAKFGQKVFTILGALLATFSLITGHVNVALVIASLYFATGFAHTLTVYRFYRSTRKKIGWLFVTFQGLLSVGFTLWFVARALGFLGAETAA